MFTFTLILILVGFTQQSMAQQQVNKNGFDVGVTDTQDQKLWPCEKESCEEPSIQQQPPEFKDDGNTEFSMLTEDSEIKQKSDLVPYSQDCDENCKNQIMKHQVGTLPPAPELLDDLEEDDEMLEVGELPIQINNETGFEGVDKQNFKPPKQNILHNNAKHLNFPNWVLYLIAFSLVCVVL